MRLSPRKLQQFRARVWRFYRKHRRDFPWRNTTDPYRILVSELMLQQTQTSRVAEYYPRFLKRFPSAAALAEAPLAEVLRYWQGLGYNRRAKFLKAACEVVTTEYQGRFPTDSETLQQLPGVGPYTAVAVAAFAFNAPGVLIETNVRAVFLHHFFPNSESVSDAQLLPLIAQSVSQRRSRDWYYALMDLGAHLKSKDRSIGQRSAHHVRQSAFVGSRREVRGAVLRMLSEAHPRRVPLSTIAGVISDPRLGEVLAALRKEGLISQLRSGFLLG